MRFTVAYRPEALDELTRIWVGGQDPQAIADASDYIDKVLRTSADIVGVDFGDFRRLEVDPLEVDFTVSLDDRYVEVTCIRLTR